MWPLLLLLDVNDDQFARPSLDKIGHVSKIATHLQKVDLYTYLELSSQQIFFCLRMFINASLNELVP